MASIHHAVLGTLILLINAHAAPSNISKLEEIAKVEQADVHSEILAGENKNDNTGQGARQKRFYNHYGYGFPPINPLIYPTYNQRDPLSDTNWYGYEDPFVHIHRTLQEISNTIRQPVPPPSPHLPIFFPVIFVSQARCQCIPVTTNTPPQTPPADTNQTKPDVVNRFPEMDDERQNWGFVVNETAEDDDDYDESDGSRPISFDPIRTNIGMSKAPPPVDHGTVQSDAKVTTTTSRTVAKPGSNAGSSFAAPTLPQAPSTCDGAVLSCCHQLTVTYDCFALQGCPDPTSFDNPCDPDVILKVIDKFQRYYAMSNK